MTRLFLMMAKVETKYPSGSTRNRHFVYKGEMLFPGRPKAQYLSLVGGMRRSSSRLRQDYLKSELVMSTTRNGFEVKELLRTLEQDLLK